MPGAAVLARLWGALAREPVPGIRSRDRARADAHRHPRRRPPAAARRRDGRRRVRRRRRTPSRSTSTAPRTPSPGDLVRAWAPPGGRPSRRRARQQRRQPRPGPGPPAAARRRAAGPAPGRGRARPARLPGTVRRGRPSAAPVLPHPDGLSAAEVLAYAPEHRPVVRLALVRRARRRAGRGTAPPVLAVHPWQRDHVLDRLPVAVPDRSRAARPAADVAAHAVAVATARHHVKTAVDVQMTSAVRTVSAGGRPQWTGRVPRCCADLTGRTPTLAVLPEAGGRRRPGRRRAEPQPGRRAPARAARSPPDELALPLAALAAPSPADGAPIVAEIVDAGVRRGPGSPSSAPWPACSCRRCSRCWSWAWRWRRTGRTCSLVVRGRPAGAAALPRLRRGAGQPGTGCAATAGDRRPLRGDLATDDPDVLRTKLLAAAVLTVLGELVAVLGRCCGPRPGAGLAAQSPRVAAATSTADADGAAPVRRRPSR